MAKYQCRVCEHDIFHVYAMRIDKYSEIICVTCLDESMQQEGLFNDLLLCDNVEATRRRTAWMNSYVPLIKKEW